MSKKLRLNQVALQRDLKITKPVGNINIPDGQNYATVSATKTVSGQQVQKSMQEVMEEIFGKDQNPTVINPSVSISGVTDLLGGTINLKGDTFVLPGTTVQLKVDAMLNPGSYNYSLASTGVTFSKAIFTLHVSGREDISVEGSIDGLTATATFEECGIGRGEEAYVTVEVTHTGGQTPKTQLGDDAPSCAIVAGTKSATSKKIVPYLPVYYGCTEAVPTVESGEALCEVLSKSARPLEAGDGFVIGVAAGDLVAVVAVPEDDTDPETNVRIASLCIEAVLPNSLNARVNDFVAVNEVPGMDGANEITYTVYYWKPEILDNATLINITLKKV